MDVFVMDDGIRHHLTVSPEESVTDVINRVRELISCSSIDVLFEGDLVKGSDSSFICTTGIASGDEITAIRKREFKLHYKQVDLGVYQKDDGQQYRVVSFHNRGFDEEERLENSRIMTCTNSHNNIRSIREIFYGEKMHRWVMDKDREGFPFDSHPRKPTDVRKLMKQLISVIEHCSSHDIEIMLDTSNIVLLNDSNLLVEIKTSLKKVTQTVPASLYTSNLYPPTCANPACNATSPFRGLFGTKANIYSVGILIYYLIMAIHPLDGFSRGEAWYRVENNCNPLLLSSGYLKEEFKSCSNLVGRCLWRVKAGEAPISVAGIKEHPWMKLP
eukprot:TRINITY_DN9540_c0_g1_i1.p1 TRINITY_DN9540_c0_g1~~TRINITY_DN9540_c0_g1_i1.p1  ORF type:complete len:330 (+),score=41.50 TRINITY_DN9540_c0_g1_i1:198-1187(+)